MNAFSKIFMSVGKLAWLMLKSGDQMFRKGDIVREVGPEVFKWGLLIGDEDADKLTDETADILVTFAHRSILEFFWAFHFILRLSKGESMDSLLGGKDPIFMENPLFLEFCLWLLKTSDLMSSPFPEIKENRDKVREILVTNIADRVDSKYFNVVDIGLKFGLDFPAFDPEPDGTEINQMFVDLLKDVISRCSKIEVLALWNYHPVIGLLSAVNPDLYSQINTLVLEVSGSMTNRQFSGNRRSLKSATRRNPCPTGIHVEIYDAFLRATWVPSSKC